MIIKAGEAAFEQLLNATGERRFGQTIRADTAQRPDLIGEGADDLDHEKRVTLGFALKQGDEIIVAAYGAEHRRAEFGDGGFIEAGQCESCRCRRVLRGDRRAFVAAIGSDNHQVVYLIRDGDQLVERGEAFPRPVQIFQK